METKLRGNHYDLVIFDEIFSRVERTTPKIIIISTPKGWNTWYSEYYLNHLPYKEENICNSLNLQNQQAKRYM